MLCLPHAPTKHRMKTSWLTTMAVCLLTACKAGDSICMMKPSKTTIAWMSSSYAETPNGPPPCRFEKICSRVTLFYPRKHCPCQISGIFFSIWHRLFTFLNLSHQLPAERRLHCCIYEIQSMEGREQGVVLHKGPWVSNEPQNRMLLWATHRFRIFPVLLE